MIVVDDLRPEIGCFGKGKLHTPHLDALAAGGMRFDRAYCQVPICMPSRASLMSGVRPDGTWRDRIAQMCPNGEPSLPRYLRENGYATVSIGKVYHYNDEDSDGWIRRYTDTFHEASYTCDGYCSGYQHEENRSKLKNFALQFTGSDVELPPRVECADAPDSAYPDGIVAGAATQELRQFAASRQPFFLAAGFYRPHLPWAVPRKYWDLYDRDEVDLADNPFFPKDGIGKSDLSDFRHYGDDETGELYSDIGRYTDDDFPVLSEAKQRESVHGYWASVSFVDAQIGKVLDELRRLGLAEDTTVVLWGDKRLAPRRAQAVVQDHKLRGVHARAAADLRPRHSARRSYRGARGAGRSLSDDLRSPVTAGPGASAGVQPAAALPFPRTGVEKRRLFADMGCVDGQDERLPPHALCGRVAAGG